MPQELAVAAAHLEHAGVGRDQVAEMPREKNTVAGGSPVMGIGRPVEILRDGPEVFPGKPGHTAGGILGRWHSGRAIATGAAWAGRRGA